MRKLIINVSLAVGALAAVASDCEAQLSLGAQLRTRTELRDGQGAPLANGLKPALFTSQRTRLNALFSAYRLKLGLSLQDVRVWGQDVSTINRFTTPENNGLMLHEAWAEIQLTDTIVKTSALYLKIGRQELVYDDQRLIGNLDWLQQARRHDAAVLKYDRNSWSFHLAAAYNQNRENGSKTIYNAAPPGAYTASTNGGAMYKSLEFLYAKKKLHTGGLSFLFFSDQFNKYQLDSIKTYTEGSWARFTTGAYFINTFNRMDITASGYYQFGKNATGQRVRGELLSVAALYKIRKVSIGPGIDFTSGGVAGGHSRTFDPLYGTPHKFWGLMDYFYAAGPFGDAGLVDYYIKSKLKINDRLTASTDLHHFTSDAVVGNLPSGTKNKKVYGQEIDLVASYNLTKTVNIEAGYAHFFSTSVLASPSVKNIANARPGANWAYLMINIRPDFLFNK